MALFTVSELKAYLGIADSSEDVPLARVVSGVDAAAKRWMKRTIEAVPEAVEYHAGTGRQRLYLMNRPVTDITSLHLDMTGYSGQVAGAFAAETALTRGEDYILDGITADERNMGCLIYLRGNWPEGIGNIKVIYDHGYDVVPDDIKLGCLMIAAQVRADRMQGGPLESEDLGDYSYTLLRSGSSGRRGSDLRQAMNLLRPFKEVLL